MVQYAPAPLLAMSGFGVMARRWFYTPVAPAVPIQLKKHKQHQQYT